MAEIKCEVCGRLVPFDEETDGPVEHSCSNYDMDEVLSPLDFDHDYLPYDEHID